MIDYVALYYNNEEIHKFDGKDTLQSIIDLINEYYEGMDLNNLYLKFIQKVETSDFTEKVSESIKEDVPEQEYTIWSSSDVAEADEQIPLVKIKVEADGTLTPTAISDNPFDQESYKIAINSLKTTEGRPLKDRLLRVDKSLNHNDPNFSTELKRNMIKANKGGEKKSIEDIIGHDPKTVSDEPVAPGTKRNYKLHNVGMTAFAAQVLLSNRDEMKAAANLKSASEDSLVQKFAELTGVDYYTDKVIDQDQYEHLLMLQNRPASKFDENYISPDINDYIQKLKSLTEDLIEKVNLKKNPDFYKVDLNTFVSVEDQLKNSLASGAKEEDLVELFGDITGVDYYTETIIDENKYKTWSGRLQDPKKNMYIQKLKDLTEDLIEKVLLRDDPDFYNM